MVFETFCNYFYRRRLAGDNNNDETQPPNADIELPLIQTVESKAAPGGETLQVTGEKYNLLGTMYLSI